MNIITNLINKIAFGFCFSVLIFTESLLATENNKEFNLTKVADGIFLHSGSHVSIDDKQHDDIANIGYIIGDNCVAVIDTGGSVSIGEKLINNIHAKTDKPVCYVINTHVHFDHILGNKVFKSTDTKFVGHHQLAASVEQNRAFFLEYYKNDLGTNPDESSIIGPDILVDKSMQLDLGGRYLTLIPFPVSHSHNDLIVIDNKTKTLWSGDLIFRQRIPSLTGSLKGWISTMEDLLKLDINLVIPGHGSTANSVQQAIKQQQDYLDFLLVETRKAIAEGLFINDAMVTIDKDNRFGWLLHDHQNPSNVSKAYTELEWE